MKGARGLQKSDILDEGTRRTCARNEKECPKKKKRDSTRKV
jgi:hypothetical protein